MPTLQNHGFTEPSLSKRYISHVAKIKPSTVIVYKKFYGFRTEKTEAELANLEKGKDGEYNGFMSPATSRKVRTLLENWLLALEQNLTDDWRTDTHSALTDSTIKQKYYPTFVTLTLPSRQIHDDNYIKRNLLNRFIIQLKNQHKVQHYFWRAEPQKNGNIHFHILIDRWIHWKAIRHEWNKILDDHGYIEQYRQNQIAKHRNGYKKDIKAQQEQLTRLRAAYQQNPNGQKFDVKSEAKRIAQKAEEAYKAGMANNWSDPNSTDIHAIEKVEDITAYVVKYVTKTDGADQVRGLNEEQTEEIIVTRSRKIIGRIWGCSDGLRNLKHFEREIAEEHDYHVNTFDNEAFEFVRHLDKEANARLEANPDDDTAWRDEDSGTIVYRLDNKSHAVLRASFPALFTQYSAYYKYVYDELYSPKRYYANDSTKIEYSLSERKILPDVGKRNEANITSNFTSWFQPVDGCPF